MKILWKEWRQQRGLVLFWICAGIIWPLMELAGNYATRKVWFTNLGSGIVTGGGAIFAIFLAMATGYADLRQGIDTFWQTRPIRIGRIFIVKLLVGMVLLAGAFAVVMTFDIWTESREMNQHSFAWIAFWATWPRAILLFGAGLFFVALIRDMAKAAFLTIWFGLLVYFLPLFLDALKPFNVFETFSPFAPDFFLQQLIRGLPPHMSLLQRLWVIPYILVQIRHDEVVCLGVMLGGAGVFTVLSIQAVRRNWRWQPGQKTVIWTLGASAALIFAITQFQVRVDLQPATHKDGQALINPMPLEWVEPPLPQAVKDRGNKLFRSSYAGRIEQGKYLYMLSSAYESDHELSNKEWDTPVYRHLVLNAYRFSFNQSSSPLYCGGLVIGTMTEMRTHSIGWPIRGSYIRDNHLYVASLNKVGDPKTCVATLDISNPEQPRLLGTIEIPGMGYYGSSFIGHGNQAYILGNNQWTVLSLEQPDQPVVAAQWAFNPRGGITPQLPRHLSELSSSHLPYGLHSQVVGNHLLCTDGVTLAMLDLSEPNDPVLVYYEDLRAVDHHGYAEIAAMVIDKDYLYLSTQQGLIVRRLVRHVDGHWSSERIGYRAATPLERLSGRNASELLLYNGYLMESDRDFGLLVYDVTDPSRPRRVMHSDQYSDGIGIWEGMLYSIGYGNQLDLFDLPAKAH